MCDLKYAISCGCAFCIATVPAEGGGVGLAGGLHLEHPPYPTREPSLHTPARAGHRHPSHDVTTREFPFLDAE